MTDRARDAVDARPRPAVLASVFARLVALFAASIALGAVAVEASSSASLSRWWLAHALGLLAGLAVSVRRFVPRRTRWPWAGIVALLIASALGVPPVGEPEIMLHYLVVVCWTAAGASAGHGGALVYRLVRVRGSRRHKRVRS